MPTKKRTAESGVIRHLLAEPYRYQFVQAVRILLHWLRQHDISYEQAFGQVLRFKNSLTLGFPASEIESLMIEDHQQIIVTPSFIGFLGVNGTLPLHYSAWISADQFSSKDNNATAFLDIFSHRMVMLFCQAWGKYRLEYTLDTQAKDQQLPLLMALAGVQRDTLSVNSENGAVTQDVAAWYAGLLRTHPASAQATARVLAEYFGVAVELEQFVGGWDYLPANRRSLIGNANFVLARGATLGLRLWRHDIRVRLHIGPLDPAGMQRFLPRATGAAALAKMLALFGLPDLQYEVRLELSAPCITAMVLHTRAGEQCRLGWSTFLPTAQGKVHGAGVRYLLQRGQEELT